MNLSASLLALALPALLPAIGTIASFGLALLVRDGILMAFAIAVSLGAFARHPFRVLKRRLGRKQVWENQGTFSACHPFRLRMQLDEGMRETSWIPYCGAAPAPGDWLARWNADPLLLAGLVLGALGWLIWRRYRPNFADRRTAVAALAVAAFLFVSPFCAMGSALFTIRIMHDTILALLLGPLTMAAFALQRRAIAGSLALWTAIHAVIFWLWHAPPLYAVAMSYSAAFWAMQVTIVGSAALWWAKLLRAPATAGTASLLATMVAMGALGALITFAGHALYAPHWMTTQQWGLSPLEDQQIAGIIMWAPVSAAYLLAALVLLYRSLHENWPDRIGA